MASTVGDFELLTSSSSPFLASGDVMRFVDISDPTQAPQGSLVRVTVAQFFAAIPVPIATTATTTQLTLKYDGTHSATFTVSSAGLLTVNSTTTIVITPNVSIGGPTPSPGAVGLAIQSTAFTGTTQIGLAVQHISTSAATVRSSGIDVVGGNAAGAYVVTSVSQLFVDEWQKGAGSTITTQYGIFVVSQTQGGTNYALFTNSGLVHFGDAVTMSSTLTITAGLSLSGATAPSNGIAFGTSAPGVLANGQIWYDGTDFRGRIGGASNVIATVPSVNAVSPTAPNRTISTVIGGTTYYIAAKTTND